MSLLAVPLGAEAPPAGKTYQIGLLATRPTHLLLDPFVAEQGRRVPAGVNAAAGLHMGDRTNLRRACVVLENGGGARGWKRHRAGAVNAPPAGQTTKPVCAKNKRRSRFNRGYASETCDESPRTLSRPRVCRRTRVDRSRLRAGCSI